MFQGQGWGVESEAEAIGNMNGDTGGDTDGNTKENAKVVSLKNFRLRDFGYFVTD